MKSIFRNELDISVRSLVVLAGLLFVLFTILFVYWMPQVWKFEAIAFAPMMISWCLIFIIWTLYVSLFTQFIGFLILYFAFFPTYEMIFMPLISERITVRQTYIEALSENSFFMGVFLMMVVCRIGVLFFSKKT